MANEPWKMANFITFCDRAITYLFYGLFFFVPLIFLPVNSELFEFNKMIFTYIITVFIAFFWFTKMILQRSFIFRRTPLDIPIALFLLSQIIATITSIDVHTSVWGYYSRSNGGLASILSYIFLYYAFVSNLSFRQTVKGEGVATSMVKRQTSNDTDMGSDNDNKTVKRMLIIILISGFFVAGYGVLERLGIDKDFWVQDVQNRVFSTLGQPNWLAAYLSVLIPVAIAFGLRKTQNTQKISRSEKSVRQHIRYSDTSESPTNRVVRVFWTFFSLMLVILFYTTLLFTKSRSGFLGLWVGMFFFINAFFLLSLKFKNEPQRTYLLIVIGIIVALTFVVGSPFEQFNKISFQGLQKPTTNDQRPTTKPQGPALEVGGTESGDIRKIVWKGAIDIAKANPLFGTGVETFAYSYYKYRPVEHNKTSEWDFLYNKAHNEYLNYLANTGFIGLGAYLLMISIFLWTSIRKLLTIEGRASNVEVESRKSKIEKNKINPQFSNFKTPSSTFYNQSSILVLALLSGYISILASNFFGFSVVVTNLYFFLIPAFVFVLNEQFNKIEENQFANDKLPITIPQWIGLAFILLPSYFLLIYIFNMWEADRKFALGENLDKSGEYTTAYPLLTAAIKKRPGEPLYSEELSTAASALAIVAKEQNESTLSAQLVDEAVKQSDYTVKKSPNNPSFWRTRIHVLFTLSQLDPKYQEGALEAAKKAAELAPTDPKIAYNYALILGQSGKIDEAIKELERAVALKPDYRDPVYALGLFYHEKATDEKGKVVNQEFFDKAVKQMENVLKLASDDAEAKARLKEWRGSP